jgi:hypothetical protein
VGRLAPYLWATIIQFDPKAKDNETQLLFSKLRKPGIMIKDQYILTGMFVIKSITFQERKYEKY